MAPDDNPRGVVVVCVFLVGFRIGMLGTARWLEMPQMAKKGDWNHTFRQILTKKSGSKYNIFLGFAQI